MKKLEQMLQEQDRVTCKLEEWLFHILPIAYGARYWARCGMSGYP
ncbi:MAG: hypothetical protein ACLQMF_04050 [Rectinemataceae bacterium]